MEVHDETPQRQYRDVSQYSLTAVEVSQLFIQAGIPRSVRSIIRFCGNGALDCTKVETERSLKYLITPESVDTRIAELQQITSYGHDAPRLDMTRHDVPTGELRHDMASHDAPPDVNEKIAELTSRVGELVHENEELKNKTRDLEFMNRVKDKVITKNEGMLEAARSHLMKFNRAIGELTTRLRLKAPEEDTSQIIAYLDAPTQPTDLEHENFVDASS